MNCAPKKPKYGASERCRARMVCRKANELCVNDGTLSTGGTGRAWVSARHGRRAIDRRHEGVLSGRRRYG
ncbi:hypothetical protein CAMGR0001_0452 [Campylobacter gracilis RM3268]|uniref:Uncharacterized protein n=1 Tax=Campylobacter gracilis RM3268 TaxID=553220 RepID=C8PHK7_9BACT|nr:hypothetical protein CAMGR0001_0452 [Campylobacter gracilis RM3268]